MEKGKKELTEKYGYAPTEDQLETYKEDYFVDLANDCIINIKKNNLKNNVLIEKTPLGNVLMYYDNSDDSCCCIH